MERRYEAYKAQIVKPFFRDHFARLDRQIVLVDALAALNSGPAAVRDMETALTEVLTAFRTGRSNLSEFDLPAEDRQDIIRGDQGRSSASHQPRPAGGHSAPSDLSRHRPRGRGRREDRRDRAGRRARDARGRGQARRRDAAGHRRHAHRRRADRSRRLRRLAEGAIFPGELPADPRLAFRGDALAVPEEEADFRFLKFRPPVAQLGRDSEPLPLPHIRLDRAMQFLLGDHLE